MVRILVVALLLCLGARPACAFNINWQAQVQRFSRYVGKHAIAQDKRTRNLGVQSRSFNRRVEGYVRALEKQARTFQAKPASAAQQ